MSSVGLLHTDVVSPHVGNKSWDLQIEMEGSGGEHAAVAGHHLTNREVIRDGVPDCREIHVLVQSKGLGEPTGKD